MIVHPLVKQSGDLQGHAVVDVRREKGQDDCHNAKRDRTEEDSAKGVRRGMPVRSLARSKDPWSETLHGLKCICTPRGQGHQERSHTLSWQTCADNSFGYLGGDGVGHAVGEDDGVNGGTDTAHDGSQRSHYSGGDSNVCLVGDLNGGDDDGDAVGIPNEGGTQKQECNGLVRRVLVGSGDTFWQSA